MKCDFVLREQFIRLSLASSFDLTQHMDLHFVTIDRGDFARPLICLER